jgi:hypothetical protein
LKAGVVAFELPPFGRGIPGSGAFALVGATLEPVATSWPDDGPVPNLSDWQAGDLVLVRSDGSATARTITAVQGSLRSGQPPFGDPDWTHVGLYVGNGLMIEAVPQRGVRYCPLAEYARTRSLRVRRLLRGGAPLSAAEGGLVVREASRYFEHGYSYWGIARHLLMHMASPQADPFFCSSFVALVHTRALRVVLESDPNHRPLLPATLVNHPGFADLDLEWRAPAR